MTKGLAAIIEEREAMRRRLRADAAFMQRHRSRARVAQVIAVVSVAAIVWAISTRTRTPTGYRVGVLGTTVLISGICALASSMVSLLRTPLRPAMSERIFRAVWLGPAGRALLR